MKLQSNSRPSLERAIIENILQELSEKGLPIVQVPRFIKDVLNILDDKGCCTKATLNENLARLGWGEQILDEHTLCLLGYFLVQQDECTYCSPA